MSLPLVVARNLLAADATGSGSSFNTASTTYKAGRLYLLAVVQITTDSGATANVPTVTGASQTWAAVANILGANTRRRLCVFRCMPSANASGALTIDYSGQDQVTAQWLADEFDNCVLGANGANALPQGVGAENTSATLAAFRRPGNATWAAFRSAPGATTMTQEAGYTELSDTAGSNHRLASEFKASSDTSPSYTTDGSPTLIVGVEIAVAQLMRTMRQDLGMAVG